MAQGRTAEADVRPSESHDAAEHAAAGSGDFGAEFRELARQRRFVKSAGAANDAPAAPAPTPEWRSAIAPASEPARTAPEPVVARSPQATAPAQAVVPAAPRMTREDRTVVVELARMSERLVEAREAVVEATGRADRAESDVAAAQQRLMAARVLVQDAQQATRMSAERCAWLEGRCETLQEALEVAINAPLLTRWRWRRRVQRQLTEG